MKHEACKFAYMSSMDMLGMHTYNFMRVNNVIICASYPYRGFVPMFLSSWFSHLLLTSLKYKEDVFVLVTIISFYTSCAPMTWPLLYTHNSETMCRAYIIQSMKEKAANWMVNSIFFSLLKGKISTQWIQLPRGARNIYWNKGCWLTNRTIVYNTDNKNMLLCNQFSSIVWRWQLLYDKTGQRSKLVVKPPTCGSQTIVKQQLLA